MRTTPCLMALCVFPLYACDTLAQDTFEGTVGTSDDGAETDDPMVPQAADDPEEPTELAPRPDPQGIINGWVYDSDRDVQVTLPTSICSGTLLRNDVVLTAKHCVSTNGTPNGPEAPANTVQITQDGPGATLGAVSNVTTIARLATEDVALLQLTTPMSMEGRLTGESTQIYGLPQSTLVGQTTLCQGWGLNTCVAGLGVLRAGLMSLASDNDGFLQYNTIGSFNQLQWRGDSGSSCRLPVFEEPQLRKALGVQTTGWCGVSADETGPDKYREFAIATMNNWAGDFTDDFSGAGSYEIDDPAGLLQGPTNWNVWNGKLLESSNAFTSGSSFEGSRYVNSAEVFSDGWVSASVSTADNDSAGLVLRYRDPTHYYRLSFDEQRRFARIVRRSGNGWTVLAENTDFDIDWSTNPRLTFAAVNNMLVGMVDDAWVLVAFDENFTYTTGRAGVYQWGLLNAVFDDLEVVRL